MDTRQAAPPPFQRPPDRTMASDSKHAHHVYTAGPPTPRSQSQQNMHALFTHDPHVATRRDPFIPTLSHHARSNSHGKINGDNTPQAQAERQGGWGHTARSYANNHGTHRQSGPPPPPPSMSSSSNPPGPSPFSLDAARSRAFNRDGAPTPYGVAPSHDPSAPPSSARPQMPPPSSPPQHPASASQSQRPPYTSAFGANRELPGLGAMHRQGGSMSISSLIGGGDTGAPVQTSQSQASPPTTALGHSMQPPSPRRGLPSGVRSDFAPYRRQPSPEQNTYGGNPSRAAEAHSFSSGSPTRSYSNRASPDLGRPSSQPYRFPGQRLYGASPHEGTSREPQLPATGIPPRPNSQPAGAAAAADEGRSIYDVLAGRRTTYGPPEERRRTLGDSHHTRPNAAELLAGIGQGVQDRDRPNTVHPVSQSVFSPPNETRNLPDTSEPPRNTWRHSAPTEVPREAVDARREEPPSSHRPFGIFPDPNAGPARYAGQNAEMMVRQRSIDRLNNRQVGQVEQYHVAPTSDPNSIDRHRTEPLSRSISSGGRIYDYPRRMGEDMQHSKSHIGFGLEASRRTGRASPLPQAVQGASAQPLSIGQDPGIKSEFGRMFSGLGSGLGSTTPSRGSPLPQNGSFSNDGESGDMLRMQRVGSQQGRKPKRVKDEEVFDGDSIDGRGTPGLRGGKRSKHAHPGLHHHHAAQHHHHHHHHHHHKPGDESSAPGTAMTNGRPGSVPQNVPGQPVHHHHHVQGTPHHHHHHHAPRPSQQAPVPMVKVPVKVHDIQLVLDEAAKHPRMHLGSHLYEAAIELPKPNSSLDDQFGYSSKPKRLPRFVRNPINCTFTIRVPRFYLKPRQRQHIVLERHLWGARVYRDDSDPIAAAIHSGWIRGEWDDTVDIALLDPRITAPNDPSDVEETLTHPPAAPVTPPADMDVHIDILILPQVQNYTGSVEYGISSRKAKATEGLSFMIHKIRWVEEGIGSRGQERTAAALKRRLDASATLLALQSGVDGALKVNGMTQLHA